MSVLESERVRSAWASLLVWVFVLFMPMYVLATLLFAFVTLELGIAVGNGGAFVVGVLSGGLAYATANALEARVLRAIGLPPMRSA